MKRMGRFFLALAATLVFSAAICGWVAALVYLPHPWNLVFAVGSVLVGFAWVMSAEHPEDLW